MVTHSATDTELNLELNGETLTKIPHEHVPKSHVITCDYMCDDM